MCNETSVALNTDSRDENEVKRPLKDTLVLSFSFLAIYTSYLAIQNLQSSLNEEGSLGVVALSCLYGTIILSGILAPSFIKIVGAKRSLVIAWIIHTVYVGSNFYPSWATLIPSSVLLGGIAGPMWTSQGLYLTANGNAYSKLINENFHSALSKLNGIFFTCYEATQIIGNLISSLVLSKSSSVENNNTAISCGAEFCATASNVTSVIEKPDQNVIYILLGIFLACDLVGLCLTFFFLPELKMKASQDKPISNSVVSCCTTMVDKKMLLLIPTFMSNAMTLGILFADYTQAFISCSLGISMVGFIMASYGGTTAVLALFVSRMAKYTGRYSLFIVGNIIDAAMPIALLYWNPSPDHPAFFYIVPTVWGVAEAILQAQFNSLVSIMFEEKLDSAFANYHTSKALAFTATFVLGTFLCLKTRLYIAIGVSLFGFLGYISAELVFHRQTMSIQK
ncbi:hypothetical protein LOTGIDRAFT_152636 [Lottia gigantea]|uniref:Major facilitator superfamily (MFS) profile domain-containing protein n=1 Tax=Lottia gigantea TaxID=225164 RepID=V4ARS1_LOTGI|nr:hypothetical protein LOTGIDRAFT_152636 [Lottia gigantea]ESO97545.1 hypothetical protein LOTGIDRAFT_152636 [Lottia gigantea]